MTIKTTSAIITIIVAVAGLIAEPLALLEQQHAFGLKQVPGFPRTAPIFEEPSSLIKKIAVIENSSGQNTAPRVKEIGFIHNKTGNLSSTRDPLPGHEHEQSAMILPLRDDHGVYSGVITFSASYLVQLELYHLKKLPTGNVNIVTSLTPNELVNTTSVPFSTTFSASAVALHSYSYIPFVAVYVVDAIITPPAIP